MTKENGNIIPVVDLPELPEGWGWHLVSTRMEDGRYAYVAKVGDTIVSSVRGCFFTPVPTADATADGFLAEAEARIIDELGDKKVLKGKPGAARQLAVAKHENVRGGQRDAETELRDAEALQQALFDNIFNPSKGRTRTVTVNKEELDKAKEDGTLEAFLAEHGMRIL